VPARGFDNAAALILRTCARLVGQVAVGQATGRAGEFPTRTRRAWGPTAKRAAARYERHSTAAIRRVTGSPIIWKELRTPRLRRKGHATLAVVVTGLAHLAVYGMWSGGDFLGSSAVHTGYMVVILSRAAICTAVLAGTAIGAEKESRCWPLLLSTTLSDAHIVIGKGIGVFRRCFPVWALLFLHISLFAPMGYVLHPAMFLHLPMVVG